MRNLFLSVVVFGNFFLFPCLAGAKTISTDTSFDDSNLNQLLKNSQHGLIYVWSPKMPLSIKGISEITEAAGAAHLKVTFLIDPTLSVAAYSEAKKHSEIPKDALRTLHSNALSKNGALLHFPSLFFYAQGKIQGRPILGDRGLQGFTQIIQDKISEEKNPSKRKIASDESTVASPGTDIAAATPLAIRTHKSTELPGEFGYYDKPIFGTRWMGLHVDWSQSSFFNLDTLQLVNLGYTNDTYATPNDHLYTAYWATPGGPPGGELGIMETSEFMKIAKDATYHPTALFLDTTINADYQSIGTLETGRGYASYRVITGGYDNFLTYRDYKITHRVRKSGPVVTPLGPTGHLCEKILGTPDQRFGVPVISKNGLLLSAQSETDQITRIYKIDPSHPENCTIDTTFAAQTSKVAFSFDGNSVAFHVDTNLYIYRRDLKKTFLVTGLTDDAAIGAGTPWFPEFREDGSLIVPYTRNSDGKMLLVEFELSALTP